jgi:general nucleoside transport system permease protein
MSQTFLARSRQLAWAGRAGVGIAVGLLVIVGSLSLMGVRPLDVLVVIGQSLRSPSLMSDAVLQTVPILLIALGSCLCFRAGFWNIGGEAYFYAGAVAAAAAGLKLEALPPVLLLPLMAAAGGSAGAILSGVAGILRARWQINEVVVTLMMNLAMIQVVAYSVRAPLADPASRLAFSETLSTRASLPAAHLISPRVHVGVYVVIAIAIVAWYLMTRTSFGHTIRVVGENADAAIGSGIDAGRTIVAASIALGVLGGLGGMLHVAGATHRVYVGLSPAPGFGYIAIMTALLGGLHPLGAAISTLFYAVLSATSDTLQIEFGIEGGFISIFFVIVLISILATDTLLRRRSERSA